MRRANPNLGCIDPHGMYPFAPSREACPKCQAIRARQKRGLRYGWWKDPDVWAGFLLVVILGFFGAALLGAWFLDWKGWW